MPPVLSGPRKASYAILVVTLAVAARFRLGPCLLAGLVSYMILDLAERRLRERGARPGAAKALAVAVYAVLAVALAWVFVKFLRVGLSRVPAILDQVLPRVSQLSDRWGLDLPIDNAREARDLLVSSLKENFASVGKTGGTFGRELFQVVAGMLVAVFRFTSPPDPEDRSDLFDALRHEFSARVSAFMRSFERVVGAQVAISLINTALTAVFLHAAGFPFKRFLILNTFVCGLVPLAGNILSNGAIVTAGLTVSVELAAVGLVYLLVIHKLEYLLNSRIVGGLIDTPMWMTLLGLVVGEALMGVPGVLLAPALVHYVREELRLVPASRA